MDLLTSDWYWTHGCWVGRKARVCGQKLLGSSSSGCSELSQMERICQKLSLILYENFGFIFQVHSRTFQCFSAFSQLSNARFRIFFFREIHPRYIQFFFHKYTRTSSIRPSEKRHSGISSTLFILSLGLVHLSYIQTMSVFLGSRVAKLKELGCILMTLLRATLHCYNVSELHFIMSILGASLGISKKFGCNSCQ